MVREFLGPDGHRGWLPPDRTAALLCCYGIPLAALVPVHSEDASAGAFAAGGGVLVVLKANVPGLVHKTEAGGVELDPRTETDVRAAYQRLFGPLVAFGRQRRTIRGWRSRLRRSGARSRRVRPLTSRAPFMPNGLT